MKNIYIKYLHNITGDFAEVQTAGIYCRKNVLLMTHLPISPMLNDAVHLEIQCGPDGYSARK